MLFLGKVGVGGREDGRERMGERGWERERMGERGWECEGGDHLYWSPGVSGSKPCRHVRVSGAVTALRARNKQGE